MSNKLGLRGAAIAAMLMALPAMAAAQNYPPGGGPGGPGVAPAGPQRDARGFWPRRGIYGGIGLGFGTMGADCEFCTDETFTGVGFHGNIGWHLSPQLGIFADGYGLAVDPGTDGEALLIQAMWNFGVQFWVTPPLWLKGGVGVAQQTLQSDTFESETDTVPSILLAGGYELLHGPNFSIDVDARVGAGFYEENQGGTVTNVGIQFSVNWHALFSGAMIIIH